MITRRRLGRLIASSAALAPLLGARAFAAGDDDLPPNLFISPCGQPFRAAITEPYPVAAWFAQADKSGDGKLDRGEFVADAAAFFALLDVNGDGELDPSEIHRYEHEIAPEVIGLKPGADMDTLGLGPRLYGGRIWLAQSDSNPFTIVPSGDQPGENTRPDHDLDESAQGASPYSFFDEPEPLLAADTQLDGFVSKGNFLDLAGRHFDKLDPQGLGYLTLARLPKTRIQLAIERIQRRLRRP